MIISRRGLLIGAPAVVAASTLMPISATRKFSLESYSEIPSFTRWALVRDSLSEKNIWMMESHAENFVRKLDVIKFVQMPLNTSYNDPNRIKLMQIYNAPVIYEIPSLLLK